MFSILRMLSTPNALDSQEEKEKPSSKSAGSVGQYDNLHEQPTLLSAVEGTLSSFYKDEGDILLDKLQSNNIQIYFDDGSSAVPETGLFDKDENIIVLSSLPNDVLDISKNLYNLLKQM